MAANIGLAVGQQVLLNDGREGTVRFVGATQFAPGIWVGVELPDATGKNDGAVQGTRYFECPPTHGIFVRPIALKASAEATSNITAVTTTTTASIQQQPATKGRSVVSPPIGARPRLSKPGSSIPPGSATKPRTSIPAGSATKPAAPPIASKITRATSRRTSPTIRPGSAQQPSSRPSSRPSSVSSQAGTDNLRPALKRNSTSSSGSASTTDDDGSPRPKKSVTFANPLKSGRTSSTRTVSSTAASSATTGKAPMTAPAAKQSVTVPTVKQPRTVSPAPRPAPDTAAAHREIEDLKAKLRIIEKKRAEDREKINSLEDVKNERDRFERIIQTLQVKYQGQGQELSELRKQVREANDKIRDFEERQTDMDSALELATVDREMAEELAESYKAELEDAKAKAEMLQLELDIAREENAELSKGMSPEELASTGWTQMVKENERLREALIRLRDISREQEAELRDRVKDLEHDITDFETIRHELGTVKEQLAAKDLAIDELREQLDAARVQDEYLVRMEEAAHAMQEDMKTMKAAQEYLEELAAINDELEANHIQHEKELQEEIEIRDAIIAEQRAHTLAQQKANEDLQQTVFNFRSLVAKLQGDLEDMRESHAVTETEAERLKARTRAMEELNSTLRTSARQADTRALDMDLERVKAQEVELRLEITTLFLPDTFKTVEESVAALLRFKRVAAKAHILSTSLKERLSMPCAAGDEIAVITECAAMNDLARVSSLCSQFVVSISHCSMDKFIQYGNASNDLQPVERLLDDWISKTRQHRLSEEAMLLPELTRMKELLAHLGEVHLTNDSTPFSRIHTAAVMTLWNLECATVLLSTITARVRRTLGETDQDQEVAQLWTDWAEGAVAQTRNAKVVAAKTVQVIEDLRRRSLVPKPETLEAFENCELASANLDMFAKDVGVALEKRFNDTDMQPPRYADVIQIVERTEEAQGSKYMAKARSAATMVAELRTTCADMSQLEEIELAPSPWVALSEAHKEELKTPALFEADMANLKSDLVRSQQELAARDRELETANLKIETLESRMHDLKARVARATETETRLETAEDKVATLTERLEKQSAKLRSLELEKEKLEQAANAKLMAAGADATATEPATAGAKDARVSSSRSIQADLDRLLGEMRSMSRLVIEENQRMRLVRAQWLQEPLVKTTTPAERRKVSLARESKVVLGELVNLTSNANVFDMASLPADKMAWKPAKSTPEFHTAKQLEDFSTWEAWQDDTISQLEDLTFISPNDLRVKSANKISKPIARLEVRIADVDTENTGPRDVEIGLPGDWISSHEWAAVMMARMDVVELELRALNDHFKENTVEKFMSSLENYDWDNDDDDDDDTEPRNPEVEKFLKSLEDYDWENDTDDDE
ncbi:hypothetical protein VTJ49DRAFT_5583 [Mycothermus thermophilus]|uniref:CAP-Gly domain-containing protein n=1 Tax=Humicola insolens TaxID=85995 RepID=A0ABR3VKN8_HUMIN